MWRSLADKISVFFTKGKTKFVLERSNGNERRLVEICGMTPDEALKSLSTTEQGLKNSQVELLQEEFGPNEITREKKIGFLSGILRRFANPLVVLLLIISGVSLSMGDLRSTLVVGGMIVISVFSLTFRRRNRTERWKNCEPWCRRIRMS